MSRFEYEVKAVLLVAVEAQTPKDAEYAINSTLWWKGPVPLRIPILSDDAKIDPAQLPVHLLSVEVVGDESMGAMPEFVRESDEPLMVQITPSDLREDVNTPKMQAVRSGTAYEFVGFKGPDGDPEELLRFSLAITRGMMDVDRLHAAQQAKEVPILEAAIERMGWPEINAFREELDRGQDVHEDGGAYWIRAIRRLFGLPTSRDAVMTYQQAAKALIESAS